MPYKDYEEGLRKGRERKRARTQYAKDNNLCIQCLKPIEEDRIGKTTCIECTQKRTQQINSDRQFCKEMRICPRCRKNKLEGNEKTCIECKATQAEYAWKVKHDPQKHQEYKDRFNRWQKDHYAKLKEQGICTKCSKRKVEEGYSTCDWCRAKNRIKSAEKKAKIEGTKERRIREGKCIWCENPIKQGYKICNYHYQMNIDKANSLKAVENRQKYKEEYQDQFYRLIYAKISNNKIKQTVN